GSNGVLNRISEDGVLTDWFRKPHKRFGTSYRIINLVVGLQLIIIVASRGDIYVLGEAYAFGLMWSFVFNSLSMLLLRFKYKGERGWKVPPNITIFGREVPIGLLSVHLVLLSVAIVNLFTKSVATIAGLIFAGTFFLIFSVSERVNQRKFAHAQEQMKEHFQLIHRDDVQRESIGIRPGNVLVTIRDYNTLNHLRWVLERTDTKEQDVVCLAARISRFTTAGFDVSMEQVFGDYEQTLFTRAVAIAEKYGKHISLLVVPARDVWSAIVQTANSLESSAIVAGLSSKMTAQEQAFRLGEAWEAAPEPKRQFVAQIVRPDGHVETFRIGPHTPGMRTEDVHLVHRLWLNITRERGLENVHHSDIVSVALTRFAREFAGRDRDEILGDLRRIEDKRFGRIGRGDTQRGSEQSALPAPAENAVEANSPEPPVLGP
ncbi:MAG TPA: amino acid permease, partial [Terriglobales bacterium]|nr:amino acid permease [Terriglobales bacterium]